VVAGLLGVPLLFSLLAALGPDPYPAPFQDVPHVLGTPPEPYLTILMVAAVALPLVLLGLLVASAAAMVVGYRRSDEIRRAQLKWFALSALFLPATLLLCWAGVLFFGGPDLVLVGLAATFLAILRHDLYDVDRALSAAVTYGVVTAAVLGFYMVASFVIGLGAGRASPVAAAAATAVCAAALAPLRSRLQRRVDRRLYPARRAALAAIEDLQRRTHAGTARPEQLEPVLRAALRDPALRVAYRLPGQSRLVDPAGAAVDPGDAYHAPVRVGGQSARSSREPGTRGLLREIAAASALLVEVVRLRIEVSRALREVESSRARLLHAGYQERRRLERDLHDGTQQRLVSLGMALRLARRHLGDGTVDVNGLLDQSVAELGTAVAELRQIANGLRPSSLDDGLGHALTTLASGAPVPVTLHGQGCTAQPRYGSGRQPSPAGAGRSARGRHRRAGRSHTLTAPSNRIAAHPRRPVNRTRRPSQPNPHRIRTGPATTGPTSGPDRGPPVLVRPRAGPGPPHRMVSTTCSTWAGPAGVSQPPRCSRYGTRWVRTRSR
jgi:signal transduction histidine kinase